MKVLSIISLYCPCCPLHERAWSWANVRDFLEEHNIKAVIRFRGRQVTIRNGNLHGANSLAALFRGRKRKK